MIEVFYHIAIAPIEYIYDMVFSILWRITGGKAFMALAGLSLFSFVVSYPFMRMSSQLAAKQSELEDEMEKWRSHIRKTFSGDERQLMLARYYRAIGYKPVTALLEKSSVLLQIPFFWAAYSLLAGLEIMDSVSVGKIASLGAADGLIKLGSHSFNLLPLLMSVLNIISVLIYYKGGRLRDKIFPLMTAVLFFVLLYNSPSGLVIYWSFNQFFSIIRSLLPFRKGKVSCEEKARFWDMFMPALCLCLILGLWIPLYVVSSAPQDFISVFAYENPLMRVFRTAAIYAGFFLLWGGLLWFALRERGRRIMEFVLAWLALHHLVMFFVAEGVSSISAMLEVVEEINAERSIISLFLVMVMCAVLLYVKEHYPRFLTAFWRVLAIGLTAACLFLCGRTLAGLKGVRVIKKLSDAEEQGERNVEKAIGLSRGGKNVIVIMLDRGLSFMLPYILEEKTELVESLDGFVFYPNTISTGGHTNMGAPAIFGGYEYTTEGMNKDKNKSIQDKYDEALKLLPKLFSSAAYRVSVFDMPYAGFSQTPAMSIYDDIGG